MGPKDSTGDMSVSDVKRVVVSYGAAVTTVEMISVEASVRGIIVFAAEEVGSIDNFESAVSVSHST